MAGHAWCVRLFAQAQHRPIHPPATAGQHRQPRPKRRREPEFFLKLLQSLNMADEFVAVLDRPWRIAFDFLQPVPIFRLHLSLSCGKLLSGWLEGGGSCSCGLLLVRRIVPRRRRPGAPSRPTALAASAGLPSSAVPTASPQPRSVWATRAFGCFFPCAPRRGAMPAGSRSAGCRSSRAICSSLSILAATSGGASTAPSA